MNDLSMAVAMMRMDHNAAYWAPLHVVALVCVMLMNGCAPTAKPRLAEVPPPTKKVTNTRDTLDTISEKLTLAERVWQQESNATLRDTYLLEAAQIAFEKGRTSEAQHIIWTLLSEPADANLTMRARMLAADIYLEDATADTALIESWLLEASQEYKLRDKAHQLLTKLYIKEARWNDALTLLSKRVTLEADDATALWRSLENISDKQLGQLASSPLTAPFIELQQLLRRAPADVTSFYQQIALFRQHYAEHPIVTYWPIQQEINIEASKPLSSIAILLPLSGKFASTGSAIKAGILSRYFDGLNNAGSAVELSFFDTEGMSPEALINAIAPFPAVVGPLRKEVLDTIIDQIAPDKLLLSLNVPEQQHTALTEQAEQYFFSLSPEQEAIQLANELFQRGVRRPIIVVADTSLYQRMFRAFTARWQQLSEQENALVPVVFNNNESLREGITEALGVAQSKSRIDQIKFMTNAELYYSARNRVDIDGVGVFASPQETELVNPIIEASITPERLSSFVVMATSRSVTYESKLNQWRDLHHLYFFDMPWLLEQQSQQARENVKQLWPDASTQFLRFYALGYDALDLLPHLSVMRQWPNMKQRGLSGELHVDKTHHVVRRLSNARVNQRPVLLDNDQ